MYCVCLQEDMTYFNISADYVLMCPSPPSPLDWCVPAMLPTIQNSSNSALCLLQSYNIWSSDIHILLRSVRKNRKMYLVQFIFRL